MAIQRAIQAGATPTTWIAFSAGLQRGRAREATAPAPTRIYTEHPRSFGTGLRWEWQTLERSGPGDERG